MANRRLPFVLLLLALTAAPHAAEAFRKPSASEPIITDAGVAEVRRAIDEERYIDAGRSLDEAMLAGVKDPRLLLLGGELNLARGRYADAMNGYKAAQGSPQTRALALQGEGLVLAATGRSDEALIVLRAAVSEAPQAWRAWNALGVAYDDLGAWADADAAYVRALAVAGTRGRPVVLNNRGYSRLLQHRLDEATADFVSSLQARPQFSEARANLRFVLALKGDYDRALAGASPREKAELLNNAGFAAGLRGDYVEAAGFLSQAMTARGDYYSRAAENLKFVKDMEAHQRAAR